MAIGSVLPAVTVDELVREGKVAAEGQVARRAADNTRDAWRIGDDGVLSSSLP
jgi:hypothetical protein